MTMTGTNGPRERRILAVVPLTCGHTMNYFPTPNPGDTLYCQYCGDYAKMIGRRHHAKGARREVQCLECSYKRIGELRVGRARTMSEVHATRHDHWVIVRDGNGMTTLYTPL